jgi:predicted ATPase
MHVSKVLLCHEKYPVRDCYPFNLSIFNSTRFVNFTSPVTFFVGENATGKSTLLQAISKRCGIYIWGEDSGRQRSEYNLYERDFYKVIDIEWTNGRVPGSFFGADLFRNYASIVDEWVKMDPGLAEFFGGKSLVSQSHGQSILSFFRACFGVPGLYLLDEPETGLSPSSQLSLLSLLSQTAAAGNAQFIIATHSPILLSLPSAVLLSFDSPAIEAISYAESSHYRLYREFFDRQRETAR